ncbi:MAG: NUDIX domain-containing protein [Acholeplasmatales bacterium]|nr:NUDIX domain-containing protein [Acholeplasmatales bacterium]
MEYCYNCGTKLISKELEHEGIIPFCPKCNNFVFPIFSAAVSMIILSSDKSKMLLIKQYGKDFYRFVAGYINKGESAEEAVYREMFEEVGLKPKYIKPLRTKYFDKSNTLMYNYLAVCDNLDVNTNYEVDHYAWIPIEEAKVALKDAKLALYFFEQYLNDCSQN